MRRSRAGSSERPARVLVSCTAALVARPGRDRRRSIEIAELDVEIVGQGLKVFLAEERRRSRDVACVGLLDRECAGGPPFRLVGVEERRSGDPTDVIRKPQFTPNSALFSSARAGLRLSSRSGVGGASVGRAPMYDFIVGMLMGSLLTILPLLVWDRIARSRATPSSPADDDFAWQPRRERSTPHR